MGNRILIQGLAPGTTYFLQFRGKNEPLGMYSQWSNIFELETIKDTVPPMPVENLTWEPFGTSFKAAWTAPVYSEDGTLALDLAGYEVTVYAPADGTVVGLPAPDPNKKAVYKTVSPNFDFSFEQNVAAFDYPRGKVAIEVRAYDYTGNVSQPSFLVAQNPLPAQVQNFDAVGGSDSIGFTWDKNAAPPDDDIKFYRIRQGTTQPAINLTILEVAGQSDSATWETINSGLQWFSITAVDVFYQESAVRSEDSATARSSLVVDNTAPAAPTNVTATTGANDEGSYIDLTWVKPADNDVQEYKIRYSTSVGNWNYLTVPSENPDGTPVQAARITRLDPERSYYVGVQAIDFQANFSAWVNDTGTNKYPLTTAKDTTAPSKPAAPTVAIGNQPLTLRITHNLQKAAGGTLEKDTTSLKVYAGTTSGFTPSDSNFVGTISGFTTLNSVFVTDTVTVSDAAATFVKVKAVDDNLNESVASDANASAITPVYLDATYIEDATITSAKISDLQANKITAGTGFVNDITVKSKFTMGDASTNGIMESFDYTPGGSAGWRIEKGGFTVNNGTIAARALLLQDGFNMIHPAYADFEYATPYYTNQLATGNAATWSIDATTIKYNQASLSMVASTTNQAAVYLGSSDTNYNIDVDGLATYIVSGWVRQNSGSAKDCHMSLRENGGNTFLNTPVKNVPTGVWTRVSGAVTMPANATKVIVVLVSDSLSTTWYWDGLQVERQMTAETAPSQYRPPSATSIDGGVIRTGEIRSNTNGVHPTTGADNGQPAWSINTQGNAQFGKANIRGTLYVGPTDTNDENSAARSGVYAANSAGWIIRGDGYAEFNNVLVRGDIRATTGTFTNTITVGDSASSSHHIKSINHSPGSVGWIINGLGYAEFNNVDVRGNIRADSGYFAGTIKAGASVEAGLSISAPVINGGTIKGANIMASNGTGAYIHMTNSPGYGVLEFHGSSGQSIAADLRVGESTEPYALQLWSPLHTNGGDRAHITLRPHVAGLISGEIAMVIPNGNLYASGNIFNMNGGDLRSSHAVVAGNGTFGTERIAIGSYSGNEGFVQGRGTANTGVRLGADSIVRIVTSGGNVFAGLEAGNITSNGTFNNTGFVDPGLLPTNGGVGVTATGSGPFRLSRATSTIRFKTDISEIDIDPQKVLTLTPKRWHAKEGYGDTEKWNIGFVAEDVHEAIPYSTYTEPKTDNIENYWDRALMAGMFAVIKNQEERIRQLEARA